MKKAELLFIPSPGLSHVVATVEMAKLLLDRDSRLSITVLIMKPRKDIAIENYTQKINPNPNIASRLRFIDVVGQEEVSSSRTFLLDFAKNQTNHIREIVCDIIKQTSEANSQLAGIVLDMFCTIFIEVANEFNLPSYVFFTSGACSLGLLYYLVYLRFEHNKALTEYINSDEELSIPCFSIPVPAKVLPSVLLEEGPMPDIFLREFKRLAETKGIMVNTFYELESHAIESVLSDSRYPKVYPVGPILNVKNEECGGSDSKFPPDEIINWLDEQPENSVVFLCFGTLGAFEETQVKEIAIALEKSRKRFLWSVRKPGEKGLTNVPAEYDNLERVLPEGFLDRTKGIGKVIGWAPQVAVLSHAAVGGFVSHCGWNSTLESVWFGVPIATFPLYAEQQLNAFELVKELGMAEAIRIDYVKDMSGEKPSEIVGSEEIEAAIRRLMAEEGSRVREKVKEMMKKSRMALEEGGSSYCAQGAFVEDVIRNIDA